MERMTGEDFIKHYGVKGMHWGVRRDREKLSDISDEELRSRLNRIRMETEYKRLTDSRSVNAGLKSARTTMKNVSGILATAAALSPVAVKVGNTLLENLLERTMNG